MSSIVGLVFCLEAELLILTQNALMEALGEVGFSLNVLSQGYVKLRKNHPFAIDGRETDTWTFTFRLEREYLDEQVHNTLLELSRDGVVYGYILERDVPAYVVVQN